jgi:hypothetical protein
MDALEDALEELAKNRAVQRNSRDRSGIFKVAIAGYTNAGKSTLLNHLTDAGILAEDKLFATLDPTTRKFELPNGEEILLTDTVGFIRNLPHHLIRAFRSTLDEVCYADAILVVVDASDPESMAQIDVTRHLIDELGASDKPVLFVYNQRRLNSCFKNVESQRETFDKCREYSKGQGFDGMIFAVCDAVCDEVGHREHMARGYDFRFGYNSGYTAPYDFYSDEDAIIEGQCDNFVKNLEKGKCEFIPTASCFQDPTPRFSEHWNSLGCKYREWVNIWYLSPEKFRELLRKMKDISDNLPDGAYAKKIIMIDNWNEWDEGHFVAPSHKFGFKYLQAIREALTACDNLPDYITPRDHGFGNYNRSWKTPDFAEICAKMLKKAESK